MTFSQLVRQFFYSLSATDKYSDFDSRKSFNRINKPTVETSLLYSHQNNSSTVSLANSPVTLQSADGVHETRLAWRHIKKWLHKHSQDLNSTLLSPCTEADLSEFQKDLNVQLPKCVAELYHMTDGQSTFNENGSGGLIYGLRLLSISEVAVMTESWRNVHQKLLRQQPRTPPPESPNVTLDENSDLGDPKAPKPPKSPLANSELHFPNQFSVPPGAVLPIYAHSMWIPIITDGVGNCIAVDLSAPETPEPESPNHKWGQVILFGRDFDIKFKIADNFGDFLLIFANDLEKGNWELSTSSDSEDLMCGSDTELIYVDHQTKKETPYLNVLRQRATDEWLASLTEEEKATEANKNLIGLLQHKFSQQVPLLQQTSADNFINDNLRKIDELNIPVLAAGHNGASSSHAAADNLLDDDMV